jgi:hypothetical protein
MHSIETRSPYIVRLGSNVTHCHGDYKDRLHKITARKRQRSKTYTKSICIRMYVMSV